MGSRRTPDSQPPSRPAPPAAPPRDAKPATQAAPAVVKKSTKPSAGAGQKQAVIATSEAPVVSVDERRGMIAKAAYLRGESRGFAPGGEAEDWLEAEQEIDALLGGSAGAAQ